MASLAGGGSGVEAEATAADWRLHHPARLELIGPSGCGKSETMLKLAADDSVWTLEEENGRSGPVFRDLIYCAPSLDDREDFLRRLSLVAERGGKRLRCHQDLLDAESIKAWSGGETRPLPGGRHAFSLRLLRLELAGLDGQPPLGHQLRLRHADAVHQAPGVGHAFFHQEHDGAVHLLPESRLQTLHDA